MSSYQVDLKSFFSKLKEKNDFIEFSLILGIMPYSETGIFSAGSVWDNVTLREEIADLVGFTEDEIKNTFKEFFVLYDKLYPKVKDSLSSADHLQRMKEYYSGCPDYDVRIYNSYSVINYLKEIEFYRKFEYPPKNYRNK